MILFFIYMLASQDVVYRIMVISKFSKHEIVIRTILQNFYPFALRIGFSESQGHKRILAIGKAGRFLLI